MIEKCDGLEQERKEQLLAGTSLEFLGVRSKDFGRHTPRPLSDAEGMPQVVSKTQAKLVDPAASGGCILGSGGPMADDSGSSTQPPPQKRLHTRERGSNG